MGRQNTIRSATGADKNGIIGVLTLAFSADPMARWSQPDPAKYLEVFPAIVVAFGGNAFKKGTAYCVDGYAGAALWLPPGVGSDAETLARLIVGAAPDSIKDDMSAIFELMDGFHPKEPHWYLPLIGVDPTQQGNGVGSALMKHALEACDRDGTAAYLESSNPRNVSLYEKFGFEVIGDIQSGTSPVVRPMFRKPAKQNS